MQFVSIYNALVSSIHDLMCYVINCSPQPVTPLRSWTE